MSNKPAQNTQDTFIRAAKYLWTEYSLLFILILMFVVFGSIAPRFATVSNIFIILRQASPIGMIALGMTFVIITGGIDLSAGHILAAAGTVLIYIQRNPEIPLAVAILACLVAATFVGFINGNLITRFRLPAFIVTLAVGTILRSLSMFWLRGLTIAGRAVPEFTQIGNGWIGPLPTPLVIWGSFAILLGCVLAYTKFGSYVYAVGGNEQAAKYSGIPVNKIRILAYMLSGFCVGVATVLELSRMAAVNAANSGLLFEFDAITAAIIGGVAISGGRGKIKGAFLGMIIIGLVSNLMIMMGFSPFLSGTVKGVIILAAVLMQKRD